VIVVPRFVGSFGALGLVEPAPLSWLQQLGGLVNYWWPVGPVLLVVLIIAWFQSGKAARFGSGMWGWLRLFPWMRSLLADYEAANFAELLALLLEHNVAYPAALSLAAEATGNRRMMRGARHLADAVGRGESPAEAVRTVDRGAFLPMLRWVLATGQEQGSLPAALESLTDLYRKRAKFKAEKLYVFLPAVLMIAIGASATLLYALAIFLPVVNMLRQLTNF
jgi:type II secretory pathway component PulF